MSRGVKIPWTANARADLDLETMRIMKQAGCRHLCVGFESGDINLLENIKKGITLDHSRAFMKMAHEIGMLVHGCFIVGLPGETKKTMKKTLDLAIELRPDTVQFYPTMVYPGTEAYRLYKSKGFISTDDFSKWLTPAGLHNTVIRLDDLTSEELVEFCDNARKKFYLRPRYILYKITQMLKNPREIVRNIKAAKTFMKFLIKGSDVRKT